MGPKAGLESCEEDKKFVTRGFNPSQFSSSESLTSTRLSQSLSTNMHNYDNRVNNTTLLILAEDTLLCLKYNIKMKLNMYSV